MMRLTHSLFLGAALTLSSVNLALAQSQPVQPVPSAEPNAQEVPVPLPAAPQSVPTTPIDRPQQTQTTPPGQNCTFETGFTDVSPDHWAYEAVTRLSSRTIARCQPTS